MRIAKAIRVGRKGFHGLKKLHAVGSVVGSCLDFVEACEDVRDTCEETKDVLDERNNTHIDAALHDLEDSGV